MIKVPYLGLGMSYSSKVLDEPDFREALCAAILTHSKPGKILVIATVDEAISVVRFLGNRFPYRIIKVEITSSHGPLGASRRVGAERCVWDEDIGTVVVLDSPYYSFFLVKKANALLATSPIYICPFFHSVNKNGSLPNIILPDIDFQPVVAVGVPFAGTGRFSPVIANLLSYFGLADSKIFPCYNNSRLHKQFNYRDNSELLRCADIDHVKSVNIYYDRLVKCMPYYSYAVIHELILPEIARQNPDVRFLYLVRDPRDLITSLYHRLVFDTQESLFDSIKSMDKDQAIAWLMREGATITTRRQNYKMTIPPFAQIALFFVEVATLPNVYMVRYEHLLSDPVRVYREILKFLRLDAISLPIRGRKLDEYIGTGKFAFQSKGRYTEGSSAARSFSDGETETFSGLRRGVAGDWLNHFGPASKLFAGETAGALLAQLGYDAAKSE